MEYKNSIVFKNLVHDPLSDNRNGFRTWTWKDPKCIQNQKHNESKVVLAAFTPVASHAFTAALVLKPQHVHFALSTPPGHTILTRIWKHLFSDVRLLHVMNSVPLMYKTGSSCRNTMA